MEKRQILVIGSVTTCLPAGRHKKRRSKSLFFRCNFFETWFI